MNALAHIWRISDSIDARVVGNSNAIFTVAPKCAAFKLQINRGPDNASNCPTLQIIWLCDEATRMFLTVFLTVSLAFVLTFAQQVRSEFPERPVSIVVPFPAGGRTDLNARIIAEAMAGPWEIPYKS